MKRNYEMPMLVVMVLESANVVTTSGEVQKPIINNGGQEGTGGETGWGSF